MREIPLANGKKKAILPTTIIRPGFPRKYTQWSIYKQGLNSWFFIGISFGKDEATAIRLFNAHRYESDRLYWDNEP